jgi:hypothetical protein
MFKNAFSNLEPKKWFDRMQPQTIAIATWLLYFEGGFTFLYWLDGADIHGFCFHFNNFIPCSRFSHGKR